MAEKPIHSSFLLFVLVSGACFTKGHRLSQGFGQGVKSNTLVLVRFGAYMGFTKGDLPKSKLIK